MQHVPTHQTLIPSLTTAAATGADYIQAQVFRRAFSPFFNPNGLYVLSNLVVGGTTDMRGNLAIGTNKFLVSASTGFITNTSGLQNQFDNALKVNGDLYIGANTMTVQASTGNTVITGTGRIDGNLTVGSSKLTVAATTGNTVIAGTLDQRGVISNSTGNVAITDTVDITGNTNVTGNLLVTGTSDLRGNISSGTGNVTVGDNLVVTGTLDVQSSISNSGGALALNDDTQITGTLEVVGNTLYSNMTATGTAVIRGAISNDTGNLNLNDSVDISGALTVTGAQTFTGRTALNGTLPSCRADRQAAQSLTSGTWTAISLDAETWDTDAFFAATSKVFTVPAGLGGLYLVCFSVQFDPAVGGNRQAAIAVNDSTDTSAGIVAQTRVGMDASNIFLASASTLVRLVAGDTLTLKALQTSGSALNVDNTSLGRSYGTALEIVRLGG